MSARANDVEPFGYLNFMFEQLPTATTVEALEALSMTTTSRLARQNNLVDGVSHFSDESSLSTIWHAGEVCLPIVHAHVQRITGAPAKLLSKILGP
jgi:IS66 C-terminal element